LALQDILCCLGNPVGNKPHQYVMEKSLQAAGLDTRYVTFEVAEKDVANALLGLESLGFHGAQIDSPLQRRVAELLDNKTQRATDANSVDLIYRDHAGQFIGDSTTGLALVSGLQRHVDLTDKQFLLFGNVPWLGSVVLCLLEQGAERIVIASDDSDLRSQSQPWCDKKPIRVISLSDLGHGGELVSTDCVINTLDSASLPWDSWLVDLPPEAILADVGLNPSSSALVSFAKSIGCDCFDGLGWMMEQYTLAFAHWTGLKPDQRLMREALEEFLMV